MRKDLEVIPTRSCPGPSSTPNPNICRTAVVPPRIMVYIGAQAACDDNDKGEHVHPLYDALNERA